MTSDSKTSPLDVASVRADFPILQTRLHSERDSGVPLVYLDNAASTQRPRQVIRAIVDVYEHHYANVHRGIHALSDQTTDLFEEARAKVQSFLHALSPDEIIFTRGATESINLVARSWGDANLRPGDELVLSEMEHHANLVPWQQLAERTGCVLRHIPITNDGLLNLDEFDRLIGPRVRLVAVTAISNVLGTINPLDAIIARARAAGSLVLVDAAQSAPHREIDVQRLDCDFLAFSGHKMLGPSGVGVLYGRRSLLEAMPPFMGGGSMIRRVRLDGFEPADLPAKFEAGTPPIAPAIGLGAAIDYLQSIGLEAIAAHERQLTLEAHRLLADVKGLRFVGPEPRHKAGIVTFTLDGVHAHDIAQLLDRRGIAVRAGHHCTMPLHARLGLKATTRASFYLYNTLDEVALLARALDEIRHMFRRKSGS